MNSTIESVAIAMSIRPSSTSISGSIGFSDSSSGGGSSGGGGGGSW